MYNYPQYAKAYPQYFGSKGPKPPVPEPEHPEYFTYGVTDISKLYGVTGLKDEYKDIKEITIPKISDEGFPVEVIGVEAFKNATIQKVHIQSNVLAIENRAFYGTGELKECTIDEGVNTIGYGIFSRSGLSEITIPNSLFSFSGGYDTFGQDSNITKVIFKEGRTKIPADVCSKMMKLTEVVIPDTVTEIGNRAFTRCNSLQNFDLWEGLEKVGSSILGYTKVSEITIPNSLKTYGSGYDTFGQDSNITKVIFKEGRTNIVKSTCEKMMKLVDVVVPKSIKTIGNYAFGSCSKLATIEYAGNEAEYAQITIGTGNDYFKNAMVIYNG